MEQATVNQEAPIEIEKFNFSEFYMNTDKLFTFFGEGIDVYNWVLHLLIFTFLVFIYNKVFRTRKLPLLKNLIVYLIIAIGAFVLLIFQVDAGLPIVYSLGVAVAMMLIVRVRYYFIDRKERKQQNSSK